MHKVKPSLVSESPAIPQILRTQPPHPRPARTARPVRLRGRARSSQGRVASAPGRTPRARAAFPAARDAAPPHAPHPGPRRTSTKSLRPLGAGLLPKWTCLGREGPDPLRSPPPAGRQARAREAGRRCSVWLQRVFHPSRIRRYFTLRFSVRESESDIGGARSRGRRQGGGGGSGANRAARGDADRSGQDAPGSCEDPAAAATPAGAIRRARDLETARSEVKPATLQPSSSPRPRARAQSPWAPPPPRPAPRWCPPLLGAAAPARAGSSR